MSREIAPTDAAVVTIGSLQAGTKENVIPDESVIKLNVRTFDEGAPVVHPTLETGVAALVVASRAWLAR